MVYPRRPLRLAAPPPAFDNPIGGALGWNGSGRLTRPASQPAAERHDALPRAVRAASTILSLTSATLGRRLDSTATMLAVRNTVGVRGPGSQAPRDHATGEAVWFIAFLGSEQVKTASFRLGCKHAARSLHHA